MNQLLRSIRFIAFDFDGVFTDNRVYLDENGVEMVVCNRSDGLGIGMLQRVGIDCAIVSKETNPVVKMRAKKLKMECHSSCDDKYATLTKILAEKHIPLAHAAFVGNDINDLPCMNVVGLPVAVADAYPEVLEISKIVLRNKGGNGAVREFCDMILRARE